MRASARAVCEHLLPGGRVDGHEYVCADLRGGKGRSLGVNLRTGVWAEFAGDAKGGDLINLWAAVRGVSNGQARDEAAVWLGLEELAPIVQLAPGAVPSVDVSDLNAVSLEPAGADPDDEDPLWWRSVRPERRWDYHALDGRLFACVYRFRHPASGKKLVRPWNPGTQRWEASEGLRPLLYAPEIAKGRGPVVLVEGEKCADAVRDVGFLATTVMGGAKAASKTDWSLLAGREVLLWPDNDPAGESWIDDVLAQLARVEATARVVR